MEALRNFGRNLFGFNRDRKVEVVREEVSCRKRQLEEEVVTKDSLNHPAKRARMADTPDTEPSPTTETVKPATSLVQSFFSTWSWFKVKTSPDLVECSHAAPPPDTIQAAPPTMYSSTRLNTDEVELLKVVNPKLEPSPQIVSSEASTISYDKLATFSGFSKAQVHPPPPQKPTSPPKGGHIGHSIRTVHEKTRKAELLSPPNIRKQMKSGLRSTFDKFFHEKDIAKRIWSGGIVKHKRPKQQNAFQYSANLADRDVYKSLLERHTGTVVKYSALTNRTNILFDSPRNTSTR
jgi:hypothetical protein